MLPTASRLLLHRTAVPSLVHRFPICTSTSTLTSTARILGKKTQVSSSTPYFSIKKMSSSGFSTVATPDAPAAIGPYSQAIKTDLGLIFVSGCVPFDPKTMQTVEGGITEQTEQVFSNLSAILTEAGVSLKSIVKATVFLKDMNDFGKLNEVYSKHMGDHKPARSCVEVARLPRDVLVEIEAIALAKTPSAKL